jgi:hypothetical protein
VGARRRGWGKGEEMTQTWYAHMNKKKKNSAVYLDHFLTEQIYLSKCYILLKQK